MHQLSSKTTDEGSDGLPSLVLPRVVDDPIVLEWMPHPRMPATANIRGRPLLPHPAPLRMKKHHTYGLLSISSKMDEESAALKHCAGIS